MKKGLLLLAFMLLQLTAVMGQRRITPVNTPATVTQSINETRRDSVDRSRLVKMEDADGKVILVDTVTGKEFVDSVEMEKQIPKMIYPLLNSVTVSVDLWSPITRAFGNSYGLIGFAGQLNMHNRYIPTLEIGLGNADYNPENNNYHYKSPIAPFFKIGADYNFLYNSNPDYLLFAGLRFGFTAFSYKVTDITIGENYWTPEQIINIPSQHANASYYELLIGLRVTVLKNLSVGWCIRYHNIMHSTSNKYGDPYYIPGMGAKGTKVGASISVYYTIPLKKKSEPVVDDLPPLEEIPETVPPADDENKEIPAPPVEDQPELTPAVA